eukprot:jgi/Tetstr1/449127/TSEL_036337.t1
MYDCLSSHHMHGGLKPATATFRGVPADLLVSICEARSDMWHKVRITAPGGSKKVGYKTICREGVESVTICHDVRGGPLKVSDHMRHDRAEARAELHVKRGTHDLKEEPFRGHGSKLKVVKGTAYFHTRVVAAKEDTDMQRPLDVKKYYMQRKAEREAAMEAGGEARRVASVKGG